MQGLDDKMCLFGSFIILVLSQLASGQRIFIKETKMYEGKTGRVTCHIQSEGHTINDVQWELLRSGTLKRIYIYWAELPDPKDPKSWLKGRSDYEHLPNGNSTLIIHNVTLQDEGNYTCQVKFDGNPMRTIGQVFVIRADQETSKKTVIIVVVIVVALLGVLIITWVVMCIKCPTACPKCCRENELNKPCCRTEGWVGTLPGDKGHSDYGESAQMNSEIVAKDIGESEEKKPINV